VGTACSREPLDSLRSQRGDMKALFNAKIKRRESFRPFAASVLEDAVPEWFEEDDAVPFMMQVFQIREEKRKLIPAVTHVDGSGRLQTVSRLTNLRYHRLIDSFRALTGIPTLLNTSFNENEPVVCRPQEALDCFLRTKMDAVRWFGTNTDVTEQIEAVASTLERKSALFEAEVARGDVKRSS
jgi:predicted NodU family carbamoyl transferase